MTARDASVSGYLDGVRGNFLRGWAWDPAAPATAIAVDIHLNGELWTTVRAGAYRDDLERAGIGDGRHAFQVDCERVLASGGDIVFRATVSGTEIDIGQSPMTLAAPESGGIRPAPALHVDAVAPQPLPPFSGSEPSDLRAVFGRQGYLVLDAGIDEALLDACIEELWREYWCGEEAASTLRSRRVQDAWRRCPAVRRVATHRRYLELLRLLFGREPLPFQTLNFMNATEQAVHADSIHFNAVPAGFMCGIWTALEDVSPDAGPLVLFPGSHRLPQITMDEVGVEAREENYPFYEGHVRGVVEGSGIEPVFGVIRKGQAIVWAANLLHGGSNQRERSLTRYSQVTHYFFSDCTYYTPLLSGAAELALRMPEWITPGPGAA